MLGFLCSLWPWLLGGLLGWLLCGLLARRVLRGPDLRGQLAEKDGHIQRLTGQMTTLQARAPVQVEKIVEKIVEKPVDRIVEKFIDRPVDRVVEKFVDRPVDRVVEKVIDRPVDRVVEKIVDRPVEKIIEKLVDRPVDSPALLAHVAALTAEVAVIAGLRGRIKQLESAPPKTVEKIVDRPVDRVVEKIVEKPVERIVEKTVEKLVPDTAGLEERDRQLADWRTRYGELERRLRDGPSIDLAAAKTAGFGVTGADDLEIIEGIGPKIAELLRHAGIRSFAQLADTPTARIQSVLDAGGVQYRIANPGTWAEQADLAARNRWSALRALQDELVAGVRVDGRAAQQATERGAADSASALSALQAQLAQRDAELVRLRQGPTLDKAAALAAGFSVRGEDDLEIIEGIGPKIASLLRDAGVKRFAELAAMTPEQIQPILDQAGPAFNLARPSTWPEQADLAARNRWQALKALQDVLNAGNRI